MNINYFESQVQAFQSRLETIQQWTNESPVSEEIEVQQTVGELAIALEELNVAVEELHQQNEELDNARQTIEWERRRYQELFEFAPDAYLVTDVNGKIQEANHSAERLLNCSRLSLINKFVVSFVSLDSRSKFRGYLNNQTYFFESRLLNSANQDRLIYSILDRELEIRLKQQGSKEFPAAIITSPILDPQGQLLGWRWNIRDITERKKAEEMSHQLQQERELNNLKARIMRTVSHEFRTPMNILSLSAQLLERHVGCNHEQPLWFFAKIRGAIERLTELLEEISNYSDLEISQPKFQPVQVDLTLFCKHILEDLMLNQDGNEITFKSQVQPLLIEVDAKLMRQILTNLLINAVKYSPVNGRVILELRTDAENAIAIIQDQGIGIPPEDQPYIFEPFYRGKNAVNRPGTGLGLDIVKKAIERHGGSISFVSNLNSGTTFTLTLPLKQHSLPNN